MKQMSDVDTTMSSRPPRPPVPIGLPSPKGVMKPVCFYHTPENASRHPRAHTAVLRRASDQRGPRVVGARRPRASRRGSSVVALELHAGRAAGAARLNRLVKQTRVTVVRADAAALPFSAGAFDACLSQEALLHVADKPAVLRECHRVLGPAGRLAFTDWIAFPSLADRERQRLWEWMAATTLQTLDSYRLLLGHAGFTAVDAEDLSGEWRAIVRKRIELHRALRPEREARFGHRHYVEYDQLHAFFVELIEAGKLGGGRFTATRA